MDYALEKRLPVGAELFNSLEFECLARATGYHSELERFGRRPGNTCFTLGGNEPRLGGGLEKIKEGKEGSDESVLQPEKDGGAKDRQQGEEGNTEAQT